MTACFFNSFYIDVPWFHIWSHVFLFGRVLFKTAAIFRAIMKSDAKSNKLRPPGHVVTVSDIHRYRQYLRSLSGGCRKYPLKAITLAENKIIKPSGIEFKHVQ